MPERKNSEKRIASNNRWTNAHYDRVNLALPKGQKDRIQVFAAARGESVNGFIGRIVMETMERDGSGNRPESPWKGPKEPQGVGVVSFLPSETLEAAQRAADAAGESVGDFMRRAVDAQAQRDEITRGLKT